AGAGRAGRCAGEEGEPGGPGAEAQGEQRPGPALAGAGTGPAGELEKGGSGMSCATSAQGRCAFRRLLWALEAGRTRREAGLEGGKRACGNRLKCCAPRHSKIASPKKGSKIEREMTSRMAWHGEPASRDREGRRPAGSARPQRELCDRRDRREPGSSA